MKNRHLRNVACEAPKNKTLRLDTKLVCFNNASPLYPIRHTLEHDVDESLVAKPGAVAKSY